MKKYTTLQVLRILNKYTHISDARNYFDELLSKERKPKPKRTIYDLAFGETDPKAYPHRRVQ